MFIEFLEQDCNSFNSFMHILAQHKIIEVKKLAAALRNYLDAYFVDLLVESLAGKKTKKKERKMSWTKRSGGIFCTKKKERPCEVGTSVRSAI